MVACLLLLWINQHLSSRIKRILAYLWIIAWVMTMQCSNVVESSENFVRERVFTERKKLIAESFGPAQHIFVLFLRSFCFHQLQFELEDSLKKRFWTCVGESFERWRSILQKIYASSDLFQILKPQTQQAKNEKLRTWTFLNRFFITFGVAPTINLVLFAFLLNESLEKWSAHNA